MTEAWQDMITSRGTDGMEPASYPNGAPITCRPDWRPAHGQAGTDFALLQREALDGFGQSGCDRASACRGRRPCTAEAIWRRDPA